MPAGKPTTILFGRAAESSTHVPPPVLKSPANSPTKEENTHTIHIGKNSNRYLNNCTNFKQLHKEQQESWIKANSKRCRCGRNHQAASSTQRIPQTKTVSWTLRGPGRWLLAQ